jgi:hypothetical protein
MLTPRFDASPQSRIEDRIRKLCVKAVAATDGDLAPALQELSQLLRGTIEHMRDECNEVVDRSDAIAGAKATSQR